MPVQVRIPTPLRKLTHNEEVVEVNAATVAAAIAELQSRFPGIRERLLDEQGAVRRFVNVYVNEEESARFLKEARKQGVSIPLVGEVTLGNSPVVVDLHYRIKTLVTAA